MDETTSTNTTVSESTSLNPIDPNRHLFLHHANHSEFVIVSQYLIENNYNTWSHAMVMTAATMASQATRWMIIGEANF